MGSRGGNTEESWDLNPDLWLGSPLTPGREDGIEKCKALLCPTPDQAMTPTALTPLTSVP